MLAEIAMRRALWLGLVGYLPTVTRGPPVSEDGAVEEPPTIDSLTMVKLPTWSKGRFVLLGDSAHCLTFSGQGAGGCAPTFRRSTHASPEPNSDVLESMFTN
jgi:hypothetical protein